jgi:hypothetical protein
MRKRQKCYALRTFPNFFTTLRQQKRLVIVFTVITLLERFPFCIVPQEWKHGEESLMI